MKSRTSYTITVFLTATTNEEAVGVWPFSAAGACLLFHRAVCQPASPRKPARDCREAGRISKGEGQISEEERGRRGGAVGLRERVECDKILSGLALEFCASFIVGVYLCGLLYLSNKKISKAAYSKYVFNNAFLLTIEIP